jgi:DNA-binding response OmpR family regulator
MQVVPNLFDRSPMTHVLVVDDDPVIADLVAFRLGRLGLEISVESDGEAGLAAARALHPDLVVLDWMMPRMNGLEVCAALRADADAGLARTPVLLLTAKAQEPDLERGFAAGATDFVAKPFSTRELITRVTAALPPGSVVA